jgi:aminopeptidase N
LKNVAIERIFTKYKQVHCNKKTTKQEKLMADQSKAQTPVTIRLQDYKPTDYSVESIQLDFDLQEEATLVRSAMSLQRRPSADAQAPLVLHGEKLKLISIAIDGEPLSEDAYSVDEEHLTITSVPEFFILELETEINPSANTELSGLYTSGGNFCTQCEAQGFRRITYMYDRPDVMTKYTTSIIADKAKYPVLLSNGNLVESSELEDGKYFAKWEDPHPKPTYLFALVAGDLACIQDTFTTQSGREVDLRIYVQHHNKDKCGYAMRSLKKAMKWDEEVYGREYDLDIYMVVAVDDFNMGAMENKGLNVFNSKYVLAKPETATDSDFEGIEGVIGHEYFHNWSGNRVTCRDWFQLSLKEGFTVFRDQQFSADMGSAGVNRIANVNVLRTHQFREDASPMAHPVRPDSYVEINNFYTVTVYNKGAEVVRMLYHLMGPEQFRKGTDLYFERHDGQAVTTDDFVKALEDANHEDFSQFKLWYSQAGTPVLDVQRQYNEQDKTYTLTIKQSCPPTPGQKEKKPFHIPLAMGLLDSKGRDIPLQLQGETEAVDGTRVLNIREAEQSFQFVNVPDQPVPSLLRGFSAPVKVQTDLTDDELCFLMAHDSDDFNRWEAGQRLAIKIFLGLLEDLKQGKPLEMNPAYTLAMKKILENDELDKALAAQAISLPSESYVADFVQPVDPLAIHQVRLFMRKSLAIALENILLSVYEANHDKGPYQIDSESIGKRSLKNACLHYLMELEDQNIRRLCMDQFETANNMTDVIAALSAFANTECGERQDALAKFYDKWKGETLVVDKWLGIQATSRLPKTLVAVKSLTGHEAFNIKNPNKVRALIGAFAHGNAVNFHDISGSGYEFIADYIIELNKLNPQIASRLATVFTMWRKFDDQRQGLMKQQLERIKAEPELSKDVYEIIDKSLAE